MIYLVKTVLIPVPRYVGCVGECQTSVGPVPGGSGGTGSDSGVGPGSDSAVGLVGL